MYIYILWIEIEENFLGGYLSKRNKCLRLFHTLLPNLDFYPKKILIIIQKSGG